MSLEFTGTSLKPKNSNPFSFNPSKNIFFPFSLASELGDKNIKATA